MTINPKDQINPKDHLGLLWLIATKFYKKYQYKLITIEDLVGYGYFGLIKACQDFDSEKTYISFDNKIKSIKFSTFAYYKIYGAMLNNTFKYESLIKRPQRKQTIFQIYSNCKIEIQEIDEKIEEENKDLIFLLNILTPVQREVIEKYYYEHKTIKEISIERGCGIKNICRIKNEAIYKMRDYANI